MAKPRELRRRIRSVESTRKITKTMEMVATSKLKRATDRVLAARPFAAALAEVIGELYSPELAERFPLLRRPKGTERNVALVLMTANRGLCGAFNSNLIREARRRLRELEELGATVELHLIGRKGVAFFRYSKRTVASQRIDIGEKPSPAHAVDVVQPLMRRFEAGELDAVDVVFAKFNSAVSTPPTTLRVLPVLPPAEAKAAGGPRTDYILRPSAEAILEQLLPLYVQNMMFRALVETSAAFYGAQRTAMKNATDAAGDMLDILRRTFNRARQGQITQELAEIVGGAEALRG
jgi:F-type H+-transporting ATPase subunit gamma